MPDNRQSNQSNQLDPMFKFPVLILTGPTGTGKSALTLALSRSSQTPNFEVISADSRQVYRKMDIGTDKISLSVRNEIPHHLIDILDPDEHYSAGKFKDHADRIIPQIIGRNALPIVVGGTGLYIRALIHGLVDVKGNDPGFRAKIHQDLIDKGSDYLYEMLLSADPERAKAISVNDTYRIIRALEIIHAEGEKVSIRYQNHGFERRRYQYRLFVLNVPRKILYSKINDRVDNMMSRDLINEVTDLMNVYGPDAPGLSAIGYRQIIRHLKGDYSVDEAIRLIKRDTRRYAKRQYTWFRKEFDVNWIDHDLDNPDESLDFLIKESNSLWDSSVNTKEVQ